MRRHRLVACLAAAALVAVSAAPAALAQDALGIRVREASLGPDGDTRLIVSVDGSALGDSALPISAFTVTENGDRVELTSVEPLLEARTRSVVVGLLLDTSGSTEGAPLEAARAGAAALVETLTARGIAVALYSFSESVASVVAPTRNAQVLVDAIGSLTSGGETAFYDAVALASRDLDEIEGLRNLVAFTDGGDTASATSLSEATSTAGQASIAVSVVALVTPEQDLDALRQITTLTGGTLIEADAVDDLAAAFDTVERSLTNQYVLAYRGTIHEPDELDVAVSVQFAGARDTDRLTVVNPRVPPGLAVSELPETTIGEAGPLAGPAALFLGLGAAFLALVLIFGTLALTATNTFDESRLARRLRVYTRGGVDTARDAWRPVAFQSAVADVVERMPKPEGFESGLQLKLERAGWPIRASEFVAVQFLAGTGVGLALGLVFASPLLGVVGFVAAIAIAQAALNQRMTKRHRAFMEQLPETLGLLAGSLKAGYALLQAVDTVAQEAAEPTTSEFKRAMTETRLGMPLAEALEGIAERVDSDDYRWVVMAINIQNEVGGNLADLLSTVAETLRSREQVRRQVQTLSAEGRLSAWVLIGLPFVLALFLSVRQPEYLFVLFTHPIGRIMVGGAIAAMVVGVLWIREMIRIEV